MNKERRTAGPVITQQRLIKRRNHIEVVVDACGGGTNGGVMSDES